MSTATAKKPDLAPLQQRIDEINRREAERLRQAAMKRRRKALQQAKGMQS